MQSPKSSSSIRPVPSLLRSLAFPEGLALTGLLCTVAQAPAQTEGVSALPEVVVEAQRQAGYKPEVVASPKVTQPLRDVPQTVSVIPQAVMQEQGATTLRDVLRNVPGISLQAGEGGGGLPGDNLSVRGFTARSDIFIDGVRDTGAYSRDPFNLEQVEVAKGPASANSGRGSTGGSINLVTKVPSLVPSYDATLTGGTDDLGRVTIDINQPLWVKRSGGGTVGAPAMSGGESAGGAGKESGAAAPVVSEGNASGAAFRLNGVYHRNDVPGRDVVEQERWGIAPSLSFGLGTDTRLTLQYFHLEQDNVPDYGIPWVPANSNPSLRRYSDAAPPVSFSNYYGLRGYDFEDIRTDVAGVILEHDFSPNVRLRNLTRYSRTHRNSAITAPRFVDADVSGEIRRNLQRRDITNELWANQTDLRIDFQTGPVKHALVTGIEFAWEDQDNRNSAQSDNQPTTNLFRPDPTDRPFGPMPGITGIPGSASADTIGVYLFDTAEISEHWELSGGIRYDHLESEFSSGGSTFRRSDDMLSWRGALVFKPVEHGSIYFGYGTSFNSSVDSNTGLSLNADLVRLKPEESRTFELGTKWDLFDERLSLSAAVFRTEKTNARTSDPTDPVAVTVLDGEQRVDGFELGLSGNITDWWRVYGGYTWLSSEIVKSANPREAGRELSNTPEHSLSLWTVFDLPGGFSVGGGAQFVDSRYNNNQNARQAPSYWLFDAMASYRISDNVSLNLNVYNLADEKYIDRPGGGHFIPGPGRSATVSMNFSF